MEARRLGTRRLHAGDLSPRRGAAFVQGWGRHSAPDPPAGLSSHCEQNATAQSPSDDALRLARAIAPPLPIKNPWNREGSRGPSRISAAADVGGLWGDSGTKILFRPPHASPKSTRPHKASCLAEAKTPYTVRGYFFAPLRLVTTLDPDRSGPEQLCQLSALLGVEERVQLLKGLRDRLLDAPGGRRPPFTRGADLRSTELARLQGIGEFRSRPSLVEGGLSAFELESLENPREGRRLLGREFEPPGEKSQRPSHAQANATEDVVLIEAPACEALGSSELFPTPFGPPSGRGPATRVGEGRKRRSDDANAGRKMNASEDSSRGGSCAPRGASARARCHAPAGRRPTISRCIARQISARAAHRLGIGTRTLAHREPPFAS